MTDRLTRLLAKGRRMINSGRWKKALAVLALAARRYPLEFEPWLWRGKVLIALGRLPESLEVLDTALSLGPGQADVWIQQGRALLFLARFDEANDCFRAALGEDPDNPLAHSGVAVCLGRAGNDAEALEHVDEAIRLSPEDRSFRAQKFFLLEKAGG